jgi:hypothetical protein
MFDPFHGVEREEIHVPVTRVGPKTFNCDCGWERVFVFPEEDEVAIIAVFRHLQDDHGLTLPVFTVTSY